MRQLVKDIVIALFLGVILPGALLGIPSQPEPPPPTVPETRPPAHTVFLEDRELDLEEYLTGVVLGEMPAVFEPEALKAQAVAARTYACKNQKHGSAVLCPDPGCCQAYISPEDYLARGGTKENLEKVRDAVLSTAPLVLTWQGQLIEATYFSCSGGQTEAAVAVWGTDFPYLQSVESPGEEMAPRHSDTLTMPPEEFLQALSLSTEDPPEVWIGEVTQTSGGGVAEITICGRVFSGTALRSLLGLPSTVFTILPESGSITIETRGYGHRVGMSQYGAEAMALEGSAFSEILAHYYPGTALTPFSGW